MKDTPMSPEKYQYLVEKAKVLGLELMREGSMIFIFPSPGDSFTIDLSATDPNSIMLAVVRQLKQQYYKKGQEDLKDSFKSLMGFFD
jgi:hypothetical protein